MYRSWADKNFSDGVSTPILLFGKFSYKIAGAWSQREDWSPAASLSSENINLNVFQSLKITIKIRI